MSRQLGSVRAVDAVVVDCVTLWISNRMLRGDTDEAILAAADELAKVVPACAFDVTLISNEVGEGVHPPTEDGLRFRDLLGMVNQRLAATCDRLTQCLVHSWSHDAGQEPPVSTGGSAKVDMVASGCSMSDSTSVSSTLLLSTVANAPVSE